MESRSPCGCATATGPVVRMQPDNASAVMMAVIGNRNARATRTGSHPSKRDSLSLAPVMVNKWFLSAHAGPDRARHAGATQPAIAGRILGEILLMIIFGEIEFAGWRDLGGDGAQSLCRERLLIGRLRRDGTLALRLAERVDRRAILR